MNFRLKTILITLISGSFILLSLNISGQPDPDIDAGLNGAELNAIQTAVPFLTIAPDSRSGGMGDGGVATSPDVNSQHCL